MGTNTLMNTSEIGKGEILSSMGTIMKDQRNNPHQVERHLSPPSQNAPSDNRSGSAGGRSNGSQVGRNKVWVPSLNFPDDINVDPREKRVIHKKPEESRF